MGKLLNRIAVNKIVLILMVIFISAIFFSMIKPFLMAIFLAGIFSALAHPMYSRFERWYKGKRAFASITTLVLILLVLLLPLAGLLGIVAAQAVKVGQSITPAIQKQIAEPAAFSDMLETLPFYEQLQPYKEFIYTKAGEIIETISKFLINSISSMTLGTVNFIFMLFIMLYTMYFFLKDGDVVLKKILYYLPLEDKDEQRMLAKFTSVTRATIKGTIVIGVVQGTMSGIAFAVVGIKSAVFWGTLMAVLSIIPGVGSALIWVPAVFFLAGSGHFVKAIALAGFCSLIVGSIDNVLRPRLVGKDTEMHDLLILFSTLGGITLFGILGFIIGPIIAALFVTIWEIYGEAFKDVLPQVELFDTVASVQDQEQIKKVKGGKQKSKKEE